MLHVGLGERRVDQVLSGRVFMFQAQLRTEGVAVRQVQDGHAVRCQTVDAVFEVPFPVIPEDEPFRAVKENL